MTMMTGAEIVIRCLQEEKVEYVFGYPGGAVLHIYDALFKQDQIKHILVRHEQAAVHAADGLARSSHKVGVALVTSGPGATNAVTGIATAYMDSIPLVVISGQVPNEYIGQDAFQECDTVGITRPCVKHNFLVNDVHKLAVTMKKAFYIANSGRPGPVVIDIPKDVTAARCKFEYPETHPVALVQPGGQGASGADQESREPAARSQATDDLHRRRGHPEPTDRRAIDPAHAPPGLSDHQHPDGPRRLSGQRPAVPGHARHAWHRRGQPGHAALRRVAGHRCAF
jgi:thiamine pyrophosphate-dependent acetolactate synthase large subunit-like protein